MSRHPINTNITLLDQDTFYGMPIQVAHAPYSLEYLQRLFETINTALSEHSRVFAFRVDLRFPAWCESISFQQKNQVITRFIRSFKAKINHNRLMARRQNPNAHASSVRYVWAREQDMSTNPHYHVVIFLNHDAFNTVGKFEFYRDNIFNRLHEAWASALSIPVESVHGLVEIPPNAGYLLRRDDPLSIADFFYRASYLCKANTKVYGDWIHCFGCSRG